MKTCEACGQKLGADLYAGTPRRYCNAACRQSAFYWRFKFTTGRRYRDRKRKEVRA